jgi:dCTP deaminase
VILTGSEIAAAIQTGEITIDPYDPARLSPNSYDWRLGSTIRVCVGALDSAVPTAFTEQTIPTMGLVLEPGLLYLGVTHERTGSEAYAQIRLPRHLGARLRPARPPGPRHPLDSGDPRRQTGFGSIRA